MRQYGYVIGKHVGLLSLLLAMVGCGGGIQRAAVEGKVSLNGKPIPNGSIFFRPAPGIKGTTAGGEIIDGHYKLSVAKGPVVGMNIVEFYSDFKTGRQVPLIPGKPKAGTMEEVLQVFPSQFNTQSTIQCEIKVDDNVQDFDLRSKQ